MRGSNSQAVLRVLHAKPSLVALQRLDEQITRNDRNDCTTNAQPPEPMLLPKFRIDFADFPWAHCSMDQRLFTSESGCGYRYGQSVREEVPQKG